MEKGISICAKQEDYTYAAGLRFHTAGGKETKSKSADEQKTSLYMGDFGTQEQVSDRFAKAQNKALQKILDQLEDDCSYDDEMAEHGKQATTYADQLKQDREQIKNLQETKQQLLDQGVDAESQEIVNVDDAVADLRQNVKDNQKNIQAEEASIWATKKALLKVHPMYDAKKEAEQIVDAAVRDAIGDLQQEGVQKLDKDKEEQQKRMDDQKEEALEEKIRIQEMKEEEAKKEVNRENMEDSVFSAVQQDVASAGMNIDSIQTDVKSLIQDQTFLDVDLKGLRVNKKV